MDCTPKAWVSEGEYLRVVLDVYGDLNTVRRCVVAVTEGFKVGLGLHQLWCPYRFQWLTDEIRQECLWTTMFADDIVICGENLERCRFVLERRRMKISRSMVWRWWSFNWEWPGWTWLEIITFLISWWAVWRQIEKDVQKKDSRSGRRKTGRPQGRFIDVVKEDL